MTFTILGLVLAGGLSSRMGRDKAGLTFSSSTLGDRAVTRLRPQVMSVAFNGPAASRALRLDSETVDLIQLVDPVEGHLGPLSGILAGLRYAESQDITHVASVPVDAPFFAADLVQRLADACGEDASLIAVAASAGAMHPVFGLWPAHLADDLEHFVRTDGKRRVRGFIERHPHVVVDFPLIQPRDGHAAIDPFLNLNRPDDVRDAEAILTQIEGTTA